MAQNEKSPNAPHIFGDLALTAVAVSVVALTYFGVAGLTPKSTQQIALNNNVLGVTTKQKVLNYFPATTTNLAFISNYTLSGNTTMSGDASLVISFSPLEATNYSFTALTIKNTSSEYRKVQLTPTFSLDGSYTSIQVTYAGATTEIITPQGVVNPIDLVVPPSSATDISLTLQPTIRLATPVSLTLDFTEAP
ncbi:MAG: hypothetical protein ACOYT9_00810 [Patescibacteria group bacterium]